MDSQLSAMLAPLENAHGPITDQRTHLRTGSVVPNQECEIFEVGSGTAPSAPSSVVCIPRAPGRSCRPGEPSRSEFPQEPEA